MHEPPPECKFFLHFVTLIFLIVKNFGNYNQFAGVNSSLFLLFKLSIFVI